MRAASRLPLALALVLGIPNAPYATAGTPPVAAQGEVPSLAPMLEKVLPGAVSIAVHGRIAVQENPLLAGPFFRRFFGLPEQWQPEEREFQAAGSGVIIDPTRGYVITNNHVVEKADPQPPFPLMFGDRSLKGQEIFARKNAPRFDQRANRARAITSLEERQIERNRQTEGRTRR